MQLDYYLWKYKIKQKDFAKTIGVSPACLIQIIKKNVNTRISIAIKIVIATGGKVSFVDLLRDKELKEIKKLEEEYEIFVKDFNFSPKPMFKLKKNSGKLFLAPV